VGNVTDSSSEKKMCLVFPLGFKGSSPYPAPQELLMLAHGGSAFTRTVVTSSPSLPPRSLYLEP
jgi:hypothetical protein